MSPGTATELPGTSALRLYLHMHICAAAAACQPGGEPARPSSNIHSHHPPRLLLCTTHCLTAEARSFSQAKRIGELSDALPARLSSERSGRGVPRCTCGPEPGRGVGRGSWGFGSSTKLIIKTCETFVSSLALPALDCCLRAGTGCSEHDGAGHLQSSVLTHCRCSRCSKLEASLSF